MVRRRGPVGRLVVWLDERLGLAGIGKLAVKKEVPVHKHTLWYYLGGMTLFLFLIQVTTGILLVFYYRPSAEHAYESIQFLMSEVEFGWLVRSLHAWSANLMIFTVFLHLCSVFFLKAYRRPREVTWFSGVILLAIVLTFGFTGYLLPWNELAYFATRVGTDIPAVMPLVGDFIGRLLKGGDVVSGATLTRFYAFHIWVLPATCFLFLTMHVLLVQKHGMSVPPGIEKHGGVRGQMRFFPSFLLRDVVGWLAALAFLAALAAYFPAELGEKADPFAPAPAGIKPEWYFMFMFQTLKFMPAHILGVEGEIVGIIGFMVGGLLLLLVPFLDRRPNSRVFGWIGIGVVIYVLLFTYLGYTVSPEA